MQKKVIYIDSTTQLTSSKNIWSNQIDMNFEGDYNRITVLQAQIPVSYYVIGLGANTFTLTEGNSSIVISIPPANYNVFSFASTVGGLLTSNSPNGYTYTISYPNTYTSPDTGLFTYQVNSIARTVSLTFPARSPISEQFGFVTASTNYFNVNGLVQTLTSTNVVNFTPENSLYIRCNFCDGESTSEQSDVLFAVYGSNVQPYSTITYINPCPLDTSKRLISRDRNLVFSICDENSQAIYMNGGNIQMSLLFYKDNTVNTSIEEYIAMKTRLLELDVNAQLEREAHVEQDESDTALREKSTSDQLVSREASLKAREDDLSRREEQFSMSNNNVVNNINGNKEESNEEGSNKEVTQDNVITENRPEDQEEIYNDRETEILGQR